MHQIPHENQPFIDHRDERIRAPAPGIAVGDLFEEVGFLVEGFAADLDVHGEVRADVEGRIDVDEFQAAGVLDLAAQGTGFERGEDELVVAPDKFVRPALGLAAGGVEEFGLKSKTTFFAWLVDVLQRLEGQDGCADIAGFPVLHQLHLALVLEEHEAVALRQRLAGLDALDEIAFLGLSEVVVFSGWAGHGVGKVGDGKLS